ncbi:MAG TPA: DUF6152 family protein [Gammaproteobacteria bacterium]
MRRRILVVCVLFLSSAVPGGAGAHHSVGGEFDTVNVTVAGAVRELHLINPHSYIVLDVGADGGAAEQWTLTMGPATKLIRGGGWTPDILKPGDRITVTGRRARRGLGLYVEELVTEDGRYLIQELEE